MLSDEEMARMLQRQFDQEAEVMDVQTVWRELRIQGWALRDRGKKEEVDVNYANRNLLFSLRFPGVGATDIARKRKLTWIEVDRCVHAYELAWIARSLHTHTYIVV